MSARAAIVLIENGNLAVIERYRHGVHYYTFPGGKVESNEVPEQTAIREALEELGLQVVVKKLLCEIWWQSKPQYYYLVEAVGGEFGTGTGPEMVTPEPGSGTYNALWLPLDDLLRKAVLPRLMAEFIALAQIKGWPETPPIIHE